LLLRGGESRREQYFDRLDNAIAHTAQLIDESIIQARLSGNPRVSAEPIEVANLADTICAEIEGQAQAKNIVIVKEIVTVQVEADRRLFLSALTNLMRNAVKFSSEGGKVTLRAKALEDRVLFEVEDSCGGMPDDLLPKLFQPFVQDNADRSGFGLGLLIVKRAVEAHHGSVRIVNRKNEGCTFVLDLPLRYVDVDEQQASEE
jgi:signal transduction histidine kinase